MSNRHVEQSQKSFGKAVKHFRLSHKMSQKELASQVNVTPQAVSKWENDLSQPDIQTIQKIAEIFEIGCDDLFSMRTAGEKKLVFTGEKASEIGRYYHFFTLFLSGLFVAFMVIAIYTFQVSKLTWHFPLGFGLLAGIVGLFLSVTAKARFNYMAAPKTAFELYEDRIFLLSTGEIISLDSQTSVKIVPHNTYRDIGKIQIRYKNQRYLLRDIKDVSAVRTAVSQSLFKNQRTQQGVTA